MMKRNSRLPLFLLAGTLAFGSFFTACQPHPPTSSLSDSSEETHEHSFVFKSNDSSHYYECECGAVEGMDSDVLCALEEAYETGAITREHLLNIAYYADCAQYNSEEINRDFTPIPKPELTDVLALEIRESITQWYKSDELHKDYQVKLENFSIETYYGCYNGYHAFSYKNSTAIYPAVYADYWNEIDGVTFYNWGSHQIKIYVWKNQE